MISFKRGNITIANVRTDNGSQQSKKLMGEDVLNLSFSSKSELDLAIGDYCNVFGQKYTINQMPPVEKVSSLKYNYKLTLESEMYDLGKTEYLFFGSNNILTETDFSLMGNIQTFADLLLSNMQRLYPGVWTLGTIANSDYQNLTFSQDNCLSALGKIATAFKTEYFFVGNVIHIYQRQQNSGLSFSYGKGKGLYKIARANTNNSNVITRLYAYGATKNIASTYRGGSSRLLLPTMLYRENNVAKYGVIEGVQVFEDVYPNRIGVVSSVDATDQYTFTDINIDFDVNAQLVPGITAKVVFNTGLLAGYQFDINTYNDLTKKFRINVNTDEKAFVIPSIVLRPAVGDTYVLVDIIMPNSYVTAAETLLETKALDYLQANSDPLVNYTVDCDPMFFKTNQIVPVLGNNVHITDVQLKVDRQIRVTALTRDLNTDSLYTLQIADTITAPMLTRVIADQKKTNQFLQLNKLTDPNRIRRNYRDVQELENMIFDADGNYFSSKIKPLSIETTMLTVGARSQLFTLSGVVFSPNDGGVVSDFSSTAGQLIHFNISTLPVTWNIAAGSNIGLATGQAYFIYAKCAVAGNTGIILLSVNKIIFNADANYYHFLIGVLHSDVDGVRGISLTYGQTNINGRYITTGEIKSNDGLTYFDLDNGKIGGAIEFGNNGTSTIVNGNLVSSGTIVLGNTAGQNAGITGQGILDSSVRIWAGAAYADRDTAPFRVTEDGRVVMTAGKIGNFTIDDKGLTNTDGTDAYIQQIHTYSDGKQAIMKIGIEQLLLDSGTALATFVNDKVGNIQNVAIYARASGALQDNNAISCDGDFAHSNGRIITNGHFGINNRVQYRGGDGTTRGMDFVNGILTKDGPW